MQEKVKKSELPFWFEMSLETAESANRYASAENHLYRPEITAKRSDWLRYRKSDSIQKEYYYAAVQVGDRYFLRAALPTEEMNHAVTMVWMYAMIAGAVGSIIVVLVTWLIFTKLSKPLKKLSDASLKIAEGDYTSRVEGIYTDEMGNLAHTFNLMADNTSRPLTK
ncbi:MAG: HAMP domain-containing protein [Acutalibacteraceae bacterium]